MATPSTFPFVPQSEYVDLPETQLPGDVWEGDVYNENIGRGLIAAVTPVAQENTLTISANNPTDPVGVYIDGALFFVLSGASDGATALLLEAELEGAAALSSVITNVEAAAAAVSFDFVDDQPHTVEPYAPATTQLAVAEDEAAVSQQRLLFGYGVVKQAVGESINFTKVAKPASLDEKYAGILIRTGAADLPPEQIRLAGFDPNWLCPGKAYTLALRNMGVMVEYVGAAPTTLDDVYLVMVGDDAGKWSASDGSVAGTNQVSTLTVTSVADGDIAIAYDGLPPLVLTATASAVNDAAGLFALWLGNASYSALGSILDNLDGTLTIAFADDQVHTFADASTGTSTVVEAIDTPAVAGTPATAALHPGKSWARPSITEGDCPRAFLRLENP